MKPILPARWGVAGIVAALGAISLVLVLLALTPVRQDPARSLRLATTLWPPMDGPKDAGPPLHRVRIGRALAASDLLQIQIPWRSGVSYPAPALREAARLAEEHEKGLIVALDWMAADRQAVLGRDWSFADPRNAAGFHRFAVAVARDLAPDYLVLAVEVNFYAYVDPAGFRGFVAAYRKAHDAIRQASPETAVLVTFQYEALAGHRAFGTPAAAAGPSFELISHFAGHMDLLGLSSYPSFLFGTPEAVPDDYFARLAPSHSRIGIFETSWPTLGPDAEADQEHYAEWLLAQRDSFELITWASASDGLARGAVPADGSTPAWFGHLGLWRLDGTPKPASAAWMTVLRGDGRERPEGLVR